MLSSSFDYVVGNVVDVKCLIILYILVKLTCKDIFGILALIE